MIVSKDRFNRLPVSLSVLPVPQEDIFLRSAKPTVLIAKLANTPIPLLVFRAVFRVNQVDLLLQVARPRVMLALWVSIPSTVVSIALLALPVFTHQPPGHWLVPHALLDSIKVKRAKASALPARSVAILMLKVKPTVLIVWLVLTLPHSINRDAILATPVDTPQVLVNRFVLHVTRVTMLVVKTLLVARHVKWVASRSILVAVVVSPVALDLTKL
jgi:hypothetical protein